MIRVLLFTICFFVSFTACGEADLEKPSLRVIVINELGNTLENIEVKMIDNSNVLNPFPAREKETDYEGEVEFYAVDFKGFSFEKGPFSEKQTYIYDGKSEIQAGDFSIKLIVEESNLFDREFELKVPATQEMLYKVKIDSNSLST